mgnify:CR=1 FL=1
MFPFTNTSCFAQSFFDNFSLFCQTAGGKDKMNVVHVFVEIGRGGGSVARVGRGGAGGGSGGGGGRVGRGKQSTFNIACCPYNIVIVLPSS